MGRSYEVGKDEMDGGMFDDQDYDHHHRTPPGNVGALVLPPLPGNTNPALPG